MSDPTIIAGADPVYQIAALGQRIAKLEAENARLRKAAARISMAASLIAVQDNSDANLDAVELRAALTEIDAARGAK